MIWPMMFRLVGRMVRTRQQPSSVTSSIVEKANKSSRCGNKLLFLSLKADGQTQDRTDGVNEYASYGDARI